MLHNLKAEMARHGITNSDIQRLLGCTERTVTNKITGRTAFFVWEAIRIRAAFFPALSIEYLFENELTSGR